MDPYGAYGAAKAGTPFDPLVYIKNPQVVLRIICWIFAIIVFGCISSQGWYEGVCQYNQTASTCRFGTFVGIVAFLICTIFLVLDARFEQFVSVSERKKVVQADLGISALWTFVWFICFCSLSNGWRKTPHSKLPPMGYGRNNVQGAITFALFSTFSWACLTFLAYRRYKIGLSQAFAPAYDPNDFTAPSSSMPPQLSGAGIIPTYPQTLGQSAVPPPPFSSQGPPSAFGQGAFQSQPQYQPPVY